MTIVVYSGTNCPRCDEVKKYLKSKEMQFEEKNIREDAEAFAFLKSRCYTSIPQIFKDGVHISSYDNYRGNL